MYDVGNIHNNKFSINDRVGFEGIQNFLQNAHIRYSIKSGIKDHIKTKKMVLLVGSLTLRQMQHKKTNM